MQMTREVVGLRIKALSKDFEELEKELALWDVRALTPIEMNLLQHIWWQIDKLRIKTHVLLACLRTGEGGDLKNEN